MTSGGQLTRFTISATFGPGEFNETDLTSAGQADIFIACYNPDGTLAWAKRAGGTSFDESYGITTLSDNSTIVTGYFVESATFGPGETNETTLVSAGDSDFFIARYNPDGTLIWARRAGGAKYINGYSITVLSDNSTVVTGDFKGSAIFGPGDPNETVLPETGKYDIFIARFGADGSLSWARSAGGLPHDDSFSITALSDNTTVVTGYFGLLGGGPATFGKGEQNETVLISDSDSDIFFARYLSNGQLLWAKRAGGLDRQMGVGITTLSDNSIVATGNFWDATTFGPGEPFETVLTSADRTDIFIGRFHE